MSRSRKIVACRVVANYSRIFALSLSQENLSLIFATRQNKLKAHLKSDGMAQLVERCTAGTEGCSFEPKSKSIVFFMWGFVVGGGWRVGGGGWW